MEQFYSNSEMILWGCLIGVFILGFTGAPVIMWTLVFVVAAEALPLPEWALFVLAVVAVIANIPPIRTMLISGPLMKILKALNFLPQISETERVALEAGVVWVEGDLFSGKPDFNKLMKEPYGTLSAEEKSFVNNQVEKLCSIIDEYQLWQSKEIPKEAWDYIKREKFLGMVIPKEYGGLGFSATAHSEVIMKLSSRSVPACITVMVPNSLGPAELLAHYGTESQKRHYLPRLAVGEEIPCFALTEPTAGSDAGSLQSEGILFKGQDGKLYIRLNWNKRWITLAAISTVMGMAFRLRDPENLLGRGEDLGITCALIPSKTPGVVLGRRHDPLGVPFYNCPTQGKDVVVNADECIIGGLQGAGRGWQMLMECLAAGRGISLPAQSTGGSQLVARVASNHAAIRKQFGVAIGKFEGIEEPLARIASINYVMEGLRRFTLGGLDKGLKPPVITAMAKYQTTELFRRSLQDGMDILAGSGISRGPRNLLANAHIASPIAITVEGANILTRTLIIFGQGALRAHPYAFKEVNALEKGDVSAFDRAFWGHIGHIVRNKFRSVLLSLTRGWLAYPIPGVTNRYYRKLSWASASFAIMADIAMGSLGGKLKFKEKITGRFADILSWMYLATAALRRFEAEGRKPEDLPYLEGAMEMALVEIQKAFEGIFANIEVPGLTWFFRHVLRRYAAFNTFSRGLSDDEGHILAQLLQTPGEQRDRMTDGIFYPKGHNEALARQEEAFAVIKRAESTEKKIRAAVASKKIAKAKGEQLIASAFEKGVITNEEKRDLLRAEELRYQAILVDDFSQDEYLGKSQYHPNLDAHNPLTKLHLAAGK